MIFDTFIENLEASYKGEFGKADLTEIKDFIVKNELNSIQIQYWYNAIKRKHNKQYLPVFAQIMEAWEEAKFMRSGDSRYHPQSPLQMLIKYQNKPAAWLIQKCKEIREAQGKRNLTGKEISFLVIWEKLKDVIEHKQEEAKQKIIDNCDKELSSPVNLDDMSVFEAVNKTESTERHGKSIHVSEVI